jgi:hypothetical protein
MRWLTAAAHIALLFGPIASGALAQNKDAGPGSPNWSKIGETAAVTLYLDADSTQRDGIIRRTIEFQDLKTPDPDGVLSRRYTNEYDCQSRMHRIGRVSSYSENRLSGAKRFQVDEWGYWRTVQPNTLFALVYLSLCTDPPKR